MDGEINDLYQLFLKYINERIGNDTKENPEAFVCFLLCHLYHFTKQPAQISELYAKIPIIISDLLQENTRLDALNFFATSLKNRR